MPRAGKDSAGAGREKPARSTPKAKPRGARAEAQRPQTKDTAARAAKPRRAATESAHGPATEFESLREACRALIGEVGQARRQQADETRDQLARFREELAELHRAVRSLAAEVRTIQQRLQESARPLPPTDRQVGQSDETRGLADDRSGAMERPSHEEPALAKPAAAEVSTAGPEVEPRNRLGMTVEPGVVVAEVQTGTPAAETGFERGDIIAAVNGEPVVTALELRDIVEALPDEEIIVAIRRRGSTEKVRVRLGALPAEPASASSDRQSRLGVTVDPCLVVAEVEPGSPAELAGLTEGDAVVAINGTPVGTAAHLRESVDQYAPGATLSLRLFRGVETLEVSTRLADAVPKSIETAQVRP